ncbi:MAG: PEP-CTERM sorting domain-containing protein [Akkermansia sp.]|nr:PEP-CTERM sorting domain-containing protein [Akkermansia sp.]
MLSDGTYRYDGNTLVFSGTLTNRSSQSIPEPTTATLSLLALAALAARRRRKLSV